MLRAEALIESVALKVPAEVALSLSPAVDVSFAEGVVNEVALLLLLGVLLGVGAALLLGPALGLSPAEPEGADEGDSVGTPEGACVVVREEEAVSVDDAVPLR